MYDANMSYEENYRNGPSVELVMGGRFPRIRYLEEPRYQFLGVPLSIPFGIPAGPLLNAIFVEKALDAGFSLPIYKTVRDVFYPSHPLPNVLNLHFQNSTLNVNSPGSLPKVTGSRFSEDTYADSAHLSISNSFGVPSQSPEIWEKDFQTLRPQFGSLVILSFQGTQNPELKTASKQTIWDSFVASTCHTALLAGKAVSQNSQNILELNLSCPNEIGAPLFRDVEKSVEMLRAVRGALKVFPDLKLIVKIGSLSDLDVQKFMTHCIRPGEWGNTPMVDAFSAINTVSAEILNPLGEPALGVDRPTGGVCGRLIFEEGISMVKRLNKARQTLKISPREIGIIGVGGVSTARHLDCYLNAGADVVQAATGAMWNLTLAAEVAQSLHVAFEHSCKS